MNPTPARVAILLLAATPLTATPADQLFQLGAFDFGALTPQPKGTLASISSIFPIVQAGHPAPAPDSGILADSPSRRIDPNTKSSPFAGIGSIFADPDPSDLLGILCTATPISRWEVITAAHCFDSVNGDGKSDVLPENVRFILNYGESFSQVITAADVWLHPDFDGERVRSLADDLAVIRLSEPLPEGVPIYPLADPDWLRVAPVYLAGYGVSGDGLNGYYIDSEFDVKRTGANLLEFAERDDEGGPEVEVVAWDFEYEEDPARYDLFGVPVALPNQIETTLGEGDSGSPIFIRNPNDSTDPTLYLAGVGSFSFTIPNRPDHDQPGRFGSGSGGNWLNASYQTWILTIPEPRAWGMGAVITLCALAGRWRLRRVTRLASTTQ